MSRVSRWVWRLLAAAVVFAGGGLSMWVHAYPAFRADWLGLVSAFAFGASLAGFLFWWVATMRRASATVDVLVADDPSGPVLDLDGVVRLGGGVYVSEASDGHRSQRRRAS